ncbi:RAD54-like protein 2 [Paragonimus westermani]|uniref:RAD54-like protein 2 n=1 Tax=Paragonimus westermani TaxID=34504 RepID=A0A5J4P3S2_9TREM|nr:RAD54-like protein 2 [Paragonimus westermani]
MSEDPCDEGNGQFRFEDGEVVLSDNELTLESKGDNDESTNNKKSRRKQTFERRNIKKVRVDALNEDARAAQKAEMERRKRLGKDINDQTKFSNIEFLLNDGTTTVDGRIPVSAEDGETSFSSADIENGDMPQKRMKTEDHFEEFNNTEKNEQVKVKPEMGLSDMLAEEGKCTRRDLSGSGEQIMDDGSMHDFGKKPTVSISSASTALFGPSWSSLHPRRGGHSRDDAILLGDSDEEQEKPADSMIIELSDGDEDDEPDFETEICELQDAANLADEHGRVIINPNRDVETEPEICLPPRIARVIKPHQVSGIRFLYDNLIESLSRFETTEGFGCILAHSMGLGKTIQIIGFLETIFRHCGAKRVLVIVPINTIQNWQAEFEMWLPSGLPSGQPIKPTVPSPLSDNRLEKPETESTDGVDFPPVEVHHASIDGPASLAEIFDEQHAESACGLNDAIPPPADLGVMDSSDQPAQTDYSQRPFKLFVVRDVVKTMTQRHQIIRQWFEEGGVLLLGYEMFRLLLNQKRLLTGTSLTKAEMRAASRRKKKTMCVDLEKEKLERMWADFHAALLDPGPQLVICDEGHRIKNSEASISKALKAIKTRRRVVLTGYPLQNNLMEYWCMVDFVRPNYLGTKQEFTNMFQRPIENGQCIDSTSEDRKVMQGRAHVLHDLLSGFVQRRSHAVLKASLPPKTEIVLLIKLSPLQRRLYAAFMRSLNSSGPLGWAQVNTLKTYAMCCKIWNHPDILWRAMEEHREALDFDIDEPTSTNVSSGTFGSRGLRRNVAAPTLNRRVTNTQTVLSGPTPVNSAEVVSNDTQFSQQCSLNWPLYSTLNQPANLAFTPPLNTQNPFFPILPQSAVTNHGLPSPPSVPAFLYSQQQQQLQQQQSLPPPAPTPPAPGTYDWAVDPDLWGKDFQPGHIEHSGKIILFLHLLEGCVLAGDKILAFTQSLYTLDLLERILRRLPLPGLKQSNAQTELSSLEGHQTSPVPNLQLNDRFTEVSVTDTSVNGFEEHATSDNISDSMVTDPSVVDGLKSNASALLGQSSGTVQLETDIDSLDDSKFLQSVLEEAKPEFVTSSCESNAGTQSEITKPDSFKVTENVPEQAEPEETFRSLHYRLASRLGRSDQPTVWTKNVHYFRLDGSTTASEREKLINHFNDPKNPAKLFLVSTRAGCLGVNLIGANRVVVFDASWNPCHDCQAVCRVYRYGQIKPCYIYRLVSDNTMEKKIYDRQVTKQGMSDRVVDELNPSQQFTRSQVELLMSFEDRDMASITTEDLKTCADLIQPDPVLASVLAKHESWITKTPFTHESLLIDRKDYRLTRVEKRLAKQRYEEEKRLSLSYQRAHLFQFQQMQALQQQQLLAAGINPALVDHSCLFGRSPNILNRSGLNYRPTYTSGMAAIDAMRQVQNLSGRNPDCKVTRVVATADLYFPSTIDSTTVQRKIPKGEMMEVIQTSKGKYLRIARTGDLFVVKTNANTTSPSNAATATDITPRDASTVDLTDTPPPSLAATTVSHNTDTDKSPSIAQSSVTLPNVSDLGSPNNRGNTVPGSGMMQGSLDSGSCSASQSKTATSVELSSSAPLPYSSVCVDYSSDSKIDNIRHPLRQHFPHSSDIQTGCLDVSSPTRLQQPNDCVPTPYPNRRVVEEDSRRSSTGSNSQQYRSPPALAATSNQFGLLQSAQPSAPTAVPSQNQVFSFEQYRTQLQRQQQMSGWSCPTCGRSPLLGCTCATMRLGSEKSIAHTPVPHPASPTSFIQKANSSSHGLFPNQSNSSESRKPESALDTFTPSTGFESNVTSSQFYQPATLEAHHNQHQQQYLRAAEEVARQSAAAYLNFNKQQLTASAPHSELAHSPRANLGVVDQPVSSARHTQLESSCLSHNNSSPFPNPTASTPARVVHDYFAQLTGQHAQQAATLFPSSHPPDATAAAVAHSSHPMAAAVQHYLAGGSSITTSRTNVPTQPDPMYVHLANHSQVDSSSLVGRATVESQHNSGRSALSEQPQHHHHQQQQQQPQHQFSFMQSGAQVTPFDRLQSHRLLPNFRFP